VSAKESSLARFGDLLCHIVYHAISAEFKTVRLPEHYDPVSIPSALAKSRRYHAVVNLSEQSSSLPLLRRWGRRLPETPHAIMAWRRL